MAPSPTSSPPAAEAAPRVAAGGRRILANLGHLVGGKAGAGLLSLIYLFLAAHRLGVRDYGVLTLVNAYALLVGSIVAFSGFHGVVRYGARALAADDRDGLADVVRLMTVLELGCGLAAILVAMAGVRVVGPRLAWPPAAIRLGPFYALAVLGTVRQTPQGILQLAGRFDVIGLHSLIQPAIRLVGATGLWFAGGGLDGFILVWLASSVCEGAAMWLLALPAWRRLAPGERMIGRWRGFVGLPGDFRRFILVTNVDLTLRELAPNLAPLTVGWLLGPVAAGLLAVAQRATNALQQPAMLLAQASYAVIADQVARGALREVRHAVWRGAAIAFGAGAFVTVLLVLFARPLLVIIGGRDFQAARHLVWLVAAARAVSLAAVAPTVGLIALGQPQRSALAGIVANLALYPLLVLLLWWLGVIGAGWHLLIQNLIAAGLVAAFFARSLEQARRQAG